MSLAAWPLNPLFLHRYEMFCHTYPIFVMLWIYSITFALSIGFEQLDNDYRNLGQTII
jgi:hypothetical protein